MRVLYSQRPYIGLFNPFLPLARALRERGHEIAVASGPEVIGPVMDAGFTWLPAGVQGEIDGWVTDDDEYGINEIRAKVNDLLELLLTSYRPQLLIRDQDDMAAALAAEISRTPVAVLGVSDFIAAWGWRDYVGNSLARLRREFHLPADARLEFLFRGPYIDLVPAPWQNNMEPKPDGLIRARYQPWDPGGSIESDVLSNADRPTILITLGTVHYQDVELRNILLTAAGGLEANVLCTIGPDIEPPTDLPDNVRAVDFVPLPRILPHCTAVLCHGGFNTVMEAMHEAVPVLCVPFGGDQVYLAKRATELGVGLGIARAAATVESVRAALQRLIDEPKFARRADQIRVRMAALPGPAAIAEVLEGVAAPVAARAGDERAHRKPPLP